MPNPAQDPVDDAADQSLLDRILTQRLVRTVFQPLVDLDTGRVVGYEALSRGPAGTALEAPDRLFDVARRAGRLRELDITCRTTALRSAHAGRLADPYRLFINAEPEALDGWRPDEGSPANVILELTERALTRQPAQLLQTVAWVRGLGWGIALDDVGADPASLALLPLVQPDVVKLDLSLIQRHPSAHIAAIISAVHAEAERSGTLVLAEGLETAAHVRMARAFGATVGQGWYFGRPGPLPSPAPPFSAPRPVQVVPRETPAARLSPFDLAADQRAVRPADKRLLIEISKQLELQARASGESTLVLATFQDARYLTAATRERYAQLVTSCALVAAFGEGMPAEPLRGVRGAVIEADDPLRGEWDVAVLGPHFAAVLVARDRGDEGPEMERRFDFVLSHDREIVRAVAAALMARVAPESDARPVGTDALQNALEAALERGGRTGCATALLTLDLTTSDPVPSPRSHVLRLAEERLRLALRTDDVLSRVGSRIQVLMADLPADLAPRIAERLAADLLAALTLPFGAAGGEEARVTATVGLAIGPRDGRDALTLNRCSRTPWEAEAVRT